MGLQRFIQASIKTLHIDACRRCFRTFRHRGYLRATNGQTDMFAAQTALMSVSPDLVKWILIALTAGFAVKMAVVPVHMWLPDAHSEAPAPMSALLSGVIISAGAYAILRISFGMVFPAVGIAFGTDFLYALAIIGVIRRSLGHFSFGLNRYKTAHCILKHSPYGLYNVWAFAFPSKYCRRNSRDPGFITGNNWNSASNCQPCRKQGPVSSLLQEG